MRSELALALAAAEAFGPERSDGTALVREEVFSEMAMYEAYHE